MDGLKNRAEYWGTGVAPFFFYKDRFSRPPPLFRLYTEHSQFEFPNFNFFFLRLCGFFSIIIRARILNNLTILKYVNNIASMGTRGGRFTRIYNYYDLFAST